MTTEPVEVQWPGKPVDPEGDDLLTPLRGLLEGISVLGTTDEAREAGGLMSAFAGPSAGVAIIESGATAIAKAWAAILGVFGGLTGLTAAITGFWEGEANSVRVAIILGASVIVAISFLNIALIIRTDLRARGEGASAQYAARAQLSLEFLRLARSGGGEMPVPEAANDLKVLLPTLVASEKGLEIQTKGGSGWARVKGIRLGSQGVVEVQVPDDWVAVDQVTELRLPPDS